MRLWKILNKFLNTPIDSSWNALFNIFWFGFDVMKRLAATWRWRGGATPETFREFAAQRSIRSRRIQKRKCATPQDLSIGTKVDDVYKFHLILFLEFDRIYVIHWTCMEFRRSIFF